MKTVYCYLLTSHFGLYCCRPLNFVRFKRNFAACQVPMSIFVKHANIHNVLIELTVINALHNMLRSATKSQQISQCVENGSTVCVNGVLTLYAAGMTNGKQPCAEALYDFEAENNSELSFQEGEIIKLISQVDENWYEGSLRSQTGYFPINYVKVLVALPTP